MYVGFDIDMPYVDVVVVIVFIVCHHGSSFESSIQTVSCCVVAQTCCVIAQTCHCY